MTLNRYGLLALDFSRRHRPRAWAALPEPITTFETIGEEIQTQVTLIRDQLLGPPRPGEHTMDLDRRAAQALSTAEELILADHPAFQPEPSPDTATNPDQALSHSWARLAAVNEAIHHRPG